jgi:hypothetical protein
MQDLNGLLLIFFLEESKLPADFHEGITIHWADDSAAQMLT